MGPIKIKIATTQIEGASEYDAPKTSEYDAPKASEYAAPTPAEKPSSDPNPKPSESKNGNGEENSCYSYEGSECIYTEPGTGTKYSWDAVKSAWVNKESGEARPAGQPQQHQQTAAQPNYKHDGTGYYYVDRLTMVKHRWNQEKNAWEDVGKVEDDEEGEESEEDEGMSEEERKARQYRKRKAAPWFQAQAEKKIEKVGVTARGDLWLKWDCRSTVDRLYNLRPQSNTDRMRIERGANTTPTAMDLTQPTKQLNRD